MKEKIEMRKSGERVGERKSGREGIRVGETEKKDREGEVSLLNE